MAHRTWLLIWLAVLAVMSAVVQVNAADTPVIEAVIDATSGATLWQSSAGSMAPVLKAGQPIVLRGHGFGPGPVTAATPGLAPPVGGVPPGDGTTSMVPSAPESSDRELSKILFGDVRALERNLSSYRARIDLESAASAGLSAIQGRSL